MACKTLKRTGNWETVSQTPQKRQRFNIFENATKHILWEPSETERWTIAISETSNNSGNTEEMVIAEKNLIVGNKSEKTPFTFKEVELLIQRRLQEREEELQEEYKKILNTKLAEQYDAFVKFTYDEIRNRFTANPSYLS